MSQSLSSQGICQSQKTIFLFSVCLFHPKLDYLEEKIVANFFAVYLVLDLEIGLVHSILTLAHTEPLLSH